MPIDTNNVKSTIINVISQQLFKRMNNDIPSSSINEEIIGPNDMLHALHRDERELRVLAVLLSLAGGLVLSFLLGVGIFIYWHWRAYRTRRLKRKKRLLNKERGLSCTSLLSSTSTNSSNVYTVQQSFSTISENHSILNNNNNSNTSSLSTITFFSNNNDSNNHPLSSPIQSIHPYQYHHQHRQLNDPIPMSPTLITTTTPSTSSSSISISNLSHQASSSSNIELCDNLEPIHHPINEKKQSILTDIPLMPPSLHPTCSSSSSSSTAPIPSAPTAKECLSINGHLTEQIEIPPPAYSYN